MKPLGYALLALGLALIAYALLMNVGVDTGSDYPNLPSRVANTDLMNQRLVFAVIGSASFVCGWLALILDRVPPRTDAPRNVADGQY